MEHQDHIVWRRDAPSSKGRPDDDADISVIGGTFWPSSQEPDFTPVAPPEHIEIGMLPHSRRLIREFPVAGLERAYVGHLEQRILRQPRDLEAHVRRVLMLRELDDADGMAGALADLFLVLGPHGRDLRARLLNAIEVHIDPRLKNFFRDRLDRGLDYDEPMPALVESRLTRRFGGTTKIVLGPDEPIDAAALTRKASASGHIDVALQVLEGMLDTDPGNTAASDALLNLVDSHDLGDEFLGIRSRLLGRRLARADRWQALARRFANGHATAESEQASNRDG